MTQAESVDHFRAIREDETAALTVAIRTDHYKALVFGLSAAIYLLLMPRAER